MKKVQFSFNVERSVLKQILPTNVVDEHDQDDEYITSIIGGKAGFDLRDEWVAVFKGGKIVFAFPIYRDSTGQLCTVRNGKCVRFGENHYELLSLLYSMYLSGFECFPGHFDCISWYMEAIHELVKDNGGWNEYAEVQESLERYHFAGKIIEQF